MAYTLSFCIPTLNFGKYIAETLNSIIAQADEEIQIVVVDGGSTDNTPQVLALYAERFPHLKVVQRDRRYGIDLDILEAVRHSDGKYCWLFSSDDVLADGAIWRARAAIAAGGWDVCVMGMMLCDLNMRPIRPHKILACREPRTFDWANDNERRDYFHRARTSTAFFSFISDLIIARNRWECAETEQRFVGSCWIIAAKVFAMSRHGLRVHFDPGVCLYKRGENDSFATNGIVRRLGLSVRGFRELGWFFFGEGTYEAREISRVIRNEYPLVEMAALKVQVFSNADAGARRGFQELAWLHFRDGGIPGRIQYVLLRWTPVWCLRCSWAACRMVAAARRLWGSCR